MVVVIQMSSMLQIRLPKKKKKKTPLHIIATQLNSFDTLQQMMLSSEGAVFVRAVVYEQLNAVLSLSDPWVLLASLGDQNSD